MKCPECGSKMFVKYYNILRDNTISRRRDCSKCGNIIRTSEVPMKEYNSLKRLCNDLRYAVDRYLEGRK